MQGLLFIGNTRNKQGCILAGNQIEQKRIQCAVELYQTLQQKGLPAEIITMILAYSIPSLLALTVLQKEYKKALTILLTALALDNVEAEQNNKALVSKSLSNICAHGCLIYMESHLFEDFGLLSTKKCRNKLLKLLVFVLLCKHYITQSAKSSYLLLKISHYTLSR